MSLTPLKSKSIPLPPVETEDGLSAKEIMDKIRSFYFRFEKASNSDMQDFGESYFLGLLRDYPQSMCNRNMTESLKQLIALIYFESKPEPEEKKPIWNGFSYEDLSIMFDLSKATIHEAIRQKEAEIKQLLEEAKLRKKAKEIALEELVREEKEKLKLEQNDQMNEQTTERTP